jgi:hypothetical protein
MRSFALVVAVVVVVVAGGAKARRRGLVDNDDDDEDDIVASVDRRASDGRLNADRRIISMIYIMCLPKVWLLFNVVASGCLFYSRERSSFDFCRDFLQGG